MKQTHTEGCMLCGKPLVYFEAAKPLRCQICGEKHTANAACEDGHYICDSCHSEDGFVSITLAASDTKSKNPAAIALRMMEDKAVNMHGPEHHYMVVAALLAAYKNAGGDIDLKKALQKAVQRAKEVPGGICGMWGSCGAGIASGIFASIVTGATPLSEREWSLSNQMTSQSLALIAANGGPRCCKRNTRLAITQAVDFTREQLGVTMESPEDLPCRFSHRNKQCRKEKCLYFPAAVGGI